LLPFASDTGTLTISSHVYDKQSKQNRLDYFVLRLAAFRKIKACLFVLLEALDFRSDARFAIFAILVYKAAMAA
jgi:hypothetical protein